MEDHLIGSSRDRQKGQRDRREREREGERENEEGELEFLLVSAPFRVPLALALIKPLRSRVYSTRKWREREGTRETRGQESGGRLYFR